MIKKWTSALLTACVLLAACASDAPQAVLEQSERYEQPVALPPPDTTGTMSLETVLVQRRSAREFRDEPVPIEVLGQLFWAGQGITDARGHRTAPSAGARYPIELHALTPSTFMHYLPEGHRVEQRADRTTLPALADVAFGQQFVSDAPVVIMISGVRARTEVEYGAVSGELMNREAGHVAQNILLQAAALGLAVVPVGGFDPAAVERLTALPPGHELLYLIPTGYPAA